MLSPSVIVTSEKEKQPDNTPILISILQRTNFLFEAGFVRKYVIKQFDGPIAYLW